MKAKRESASKRGTSRYEKNIQLNLTLTLSDRTGDWPNATVCENEVTFSTPVELAISRGLVTSNQGFTRRPQTLRIVDS